jgi:hypothetical protein
MCVCVCVCVRAAHGPNVKKESEKYVNRRTESSGWISRIVIYENAAYCYAVELLFLSSTLS